MKLPRHATIYLLIIGALSVIQMIIGANVFVLLALIYVSLFALIPMTRQQFGPNEVLFLSFVFYYGPFALIFKTMVLQAVQTNLRAPYLSSSYLMAGFTLIFLSYYAVEHFMTRYYDGTRVRKWTIFESTYADAKFLSRYTLPVTIVALGLLALYSIFSNSVTDFESQHQSVSAFNVLGSFTPLTELALVMQLTLATQHRSPTARTLVIISFVACVLSAVLVNHKLVMFQIAFTYAIYLVANRIRIQPRTIVYVSLLAAVTFLYATPLIHITRFMQVKKSELVPVSLKILNEVNYNPIELASRVEDLGRSGGADIATDLGYLAPLNLGTDRFTMLLPIDQVARDENRAPVGTGLWVNMTIKEILPKSIVGEHDRQDMADEIAWRYSLRQQGVIARPALGLVSTALGTEGPFGLFVYVPLLALFLFGTTKLVCNGSLRQNPYAVFIASYIIFLGEGDVSVISLVVRTLFPMLIFSYGFIFIHKFLK